jgi:hypothetical protein
MNAKSERSTNPVARLEWARLALDYGLQALAEAERDGATNGEIVRLCDEVIARRLRVQLMQLRNGGVLPKTVVTQMARDRELLNQPASVLGDD